MANVSYPAFPDPAPYLQTDVTGDAALALGPAASFLLGPTSVVTTLTSYKGTDIDGYIDMLQTYTGTLAITNLSLTSVTVPLVVSLTSDISSSLFTTVNDAYSSVGNFLEVSVDGTTLAQAYAVCSDDTGCWSDAAPGVVTVDIPIPYSRPSTYNGTLTIPVSVTIAPESVVDVNEFLQTNGSANISEPGTLVLLATGSLVILLVRRRSIVQERWLST